MNSNYPIPSPTELICKTETEWMALLFPARKRVPRTYWTDIAGEEFKPIPQLPGFHVTDHGRIMREIIKKNGRIVKTEIKGTWKNNRKTFLVTNPARVYIIVSREMLRQFKPHPKSDNLQAVCMDGNPRNMHLSNWEWMSLTQAKKHRKITGEIQAPLKPKQFQGRAGKYTRLVQYSDADIKEIERLLKAGIGASKIAEIFQMTIQNVLHYQKKMEKREKHNKNG